MSRLKVAIWMVTYNHQDYIEQAVESVMMQKTNFDFTLFIGEDCSTDTTRSICKALKTNYPKKIELILNENNLGSTKNAINTYVRCFDYQPNYIALLEGDDYWTDPFKLQKQVDCLEENASLTFSMTRFLALTSDGEFKDENDRFFKNDSDLVYDFNMFTKGWFGGTLTLVFRASAIDFTIFSTYAYFRDVHLYTELLKKGNGIIQNFNSAVYRVHEKGQHNSLSEINRNKVAVLCYIELYNKNKAIPQIQKKFRYFHSEHIKSLLLKRKFSKAIIENILSTFHTSDFFLYKKELKRILKYLIYNKY